MYRGRNVTYTNQEFLKRNLCLNEIILLDNTDKLQLNYKCSWDTEHGIEINFDKNYECKIVK